MSPNSRNARAIAAFKEGMAEFGWKEGSSYVIEERWADGHWERLKSLAEGLAAKKPAVIVAVSLPAARAAATAAPKTAIVVSGADMVAAGLAKSLARPGGMITGVTNVSGYLSEKYLELLLAAAPRVKRVGFLTDPTSPASQEYLEAARRSAVQHGVEARYAEAAKAEEIESAIAHLAREGTQGLVVLSQAGPFTLERTRIMKLALAQRWPVIARGAEWTNDGALLSYGPAPGIVTQRIAYYVDRILKGAKPGDLPIEQPTKFELVINARTAKLLKLDIPRDLAVRADRVIE
jgi:putative ABC transport system substrate-binding protein